MPLHGKRARLPLLALPCLAVVAQAQTVAQGELPNVEVIGVSPIPGVDVPRDRIPANVQSARATDIERSRALDLTGFMNRRLGSVFINEVQSNPFQPDVNFRGYTASPLLGSPQGLSVYMDGVRLNQPFGDVVSWDLIPKSAISSMTLNAGSNPLFGLNTLGGALALQTKDGERNPGTSVQVQAGSHQRAAIEFEHGGRNDDGLHWFVTGNRFHEQGWRVDSPSDVGQLFGKVGKRSGDTDVSLTASLANTDLNGNGLQEQRFLERDYASVYTKPDNTKNRAVMLNLALSQNLSQQWSATGNAYYRQIRTKTYNGDVNDDSLDQALYQPNAAERQALADAGYTGFPTSGENAGNTPFPKWRCIANALLLDEPAEKCNGVINKTATNQSNYGITGQLNFDGKVLGLASKSLLGAAVDISQSRLHAGLRARLPQSRPLHHGCRCLRRRRQRRDGGRRALRHARRPVGPHAHLQPVCKHHPRRRRRHLPDVVGALQPQLDQQPRRDQAGRRRRIARRRPHLQPVQPGHRPDAHAHDRHQRLGRREPGQSQSVVDRAGVRRSGQSLQASELVRRRSAAQAGRHDHDRGRRPRRRARPARLERGHLPLRQQGRPAVRGGQRLGLRLLQELRQDAASGRRARR